MVEAILIIGCVYGAGVLAAGGAAASMGDNKPDTIRFLLLSWLAFGFLLCDSIHASARQRKQE